IFQVVSYTEFRDLPAEQIAQSYLENVETKNPEKTNVEDHSDYNVNAELSSSDVSADEKESSDTFTSNSSPPIYSTSFTKTIANYPFRKHLNYEPKYTVPEDILLVKNAGSFGQRVWGEQSHSGDKAIVKSTIETTNSQSTDKYTNFQKSFNSSVSLENEDDRGELYVSITHEPFAYVQRKENISDNLSSDNPQIIEDPNTKNFDENFDVRSIITENSPLGSSETYHDVADKITKKSTEFVKKSESVDRTPTSVEISPLQIRKFSAPIVVPDLPDSEDLPQDVVDYLDDNDASKSVENAKLISKIDAEPSKAATASITTSSIMLNPLQVGITLMNADETDLMDNSEQSAAMDTNNYFQNNLQRLATVNEEFINRNQSRVDCKNENFQCDEKDKSIGVVAQKIPDNSVEIQKSIELYYAAPIHEIHYPAEYIQSSNLDITKTNNAQRSKQQYDQGNHQVDRNIVKTHAFGLPQKHNRHEYNTLKDDASKTIGQDASALIAESSIHEQTPQTLESQSFKYNNVQPVKPYISSTYREQLHLNNPFRSSEIKRPETPQLLLKIIPEGSSANDGFLVPIPQPYPIEKIVEKTVHVPHSIEIEKVIEKKAPIPVQVPVAVSQPYHVRVQVPIDHIVEKQIRGPHLYPIYIEKRIPYTVKRLQSSAYPQHMKLPATYSIEKSPSHVPIEKVTEKPAFSLPSRLSYRVNTDRPIDNNGAIETKSNKYQHKLRESVFIGGNANSRDKNTVDSFTFEPHQSETNTSQFYSDLYSGPWSAYDHDKSYIPTEHLNAVKLMILPKKFNDHIVLRPHMIAPSYTVVPRSFKRQILYNLLEKDKATIKDAGLTSPRKTTQDKTAFSQIKFSPQFSASNTQISAMTATLRRSRQPEARYTGNFRQSKMEYGFKPPMIPSVQYDEKTGSKVEN
ncbi:uncharacterized protein, partial [Linepithema humile]|uniref:uncharacterized protein n=1 Tax=Linepithema humile TaxID=83485 RepID=UPI00351E162E